MTYCLKAKRWRLWEMKPNGEYAEFCVGCQKFEDDKEKESNNESDNMDKFNVGDSFGFCGAGI